jgi:cytochrome oxidase Cu insertion factor (SCO1/SenC/PrrC family)
MNSGLNTDDPTIVAAFKTALLHQWVIAAAIFAALWIVWLMLHARLPQAIPPAGGASTAAGTAGTAGMGGRPDAQAEPAARKLLRIAFGILWIFDGILQAQPKMAAGMPSQVIQPTAANSPHWVQHLVNWAGTIWSYHPIQAGASAVWIQVGIGMWMLVATRGPLSRLSGLAGVGWGLVVWVFGESFGGIFAPGLTWLFGAPGAVLFYCVAGALIALPERSWYTQRLGRLILAGTGLFFVGMAVLQAWPGRGFWQGTAQGQSATLTGMIQTMAQTSQPHALSALVRGFSSVVAGHGFAVNLFTVITLAVLGAAFVSAAFVSEGFLAPRQQLVRAAVVAASLLCLADWVLIEDFGFFGGVGTDPNSMIPMALIFVAGYVAIVRLPAVAEEPATAQQPAVQQSAGEEESAPLAGPAVAWRDRFRPAALSGALAAVSARSVAAVGAVGVIVLGVAPMAVASASPNADPIIAQAISGSSAPIDSPAPAFQFTDEHGVPVSLASLRGKVVLLTFLDPVCTTDCTLMAQEFRQAAALLGADTRRVELVAIVNNPFYRTAAFTQAFDRQEGLDKVPDWRYLTGPLPQLWQAWRAYGVTVTTLPGGAMVGHTDVAYVIDRAGHLRREINFNPGPGTTSTQSSFAALLTQSAEQFLGAS